MKRTEVHHETVETQDYIIDSVILDNLRHYLSAIARKATKIDELVGAEAPVARLTMQIVGIAAIAEEALDQAKEAERG